MLDRINDIFIKDQTVNILPKVAVLGGTAIGSGCVSEAGGAVMKTRNKNPYISACLQKIKERVFNEIVVCA